VRSQVRALSARTLDHGFESRLRYGCLSSSMLCCPVLAEALRRADHSSKESCRLSMINNFRNNSELEQANRPDP
jgi:hypothetical protein